MVGFTVERRWQSLPCVLFMLLWVKYGYGPALISGNPDS